MFCSHCGAEIKDGATICSQCGQPLENKNQTKKSTAASRIHRITVEGDEIIKEDMRPEPGVHPVDDMTEQLPDLSGAAGGSPASQVSEDTVQLPDLREAAELSSAPRTTDETASRDTVKLDAVSMNTINLGHVHRGVRQSDAVSANTVKLGNLNQGQARDAVSQDTVELDDMDFGALNFDEMPLDTMDLDDEDEAAEENGPDADSGIKAGRHDGDNRIAEQAARSGGSVQDSQFQGSTAGGGQYNAGGAAARNSQPSPRGAAARSGQISSSGAAAQYGQPGANSAKRRPSGGASPSQKEKAGKPVKSGKQGKPGRPASKGDSSSGIWAAVGAVLVLAVVIAAIVFMFRTKVSGSSYTDLIQSGNEYYTGGSYDKATEIFEKAVESFPEKPEGYAGLADVYAATQDTGKAADILQQGYEQTHSAELKAKLEELQVGESNKQ